MALSEKICSILDSLKAENIQTIKVDDQSDEFDTIIIASGRSSRHNNSLMTNCIELMKKNFHISPDHYEKDQESQWILIDYKDTIVHLLQEEVRQYYSLEKLWSPISNLPAELD